MKRKANGQGLVEYALILVLIAVVIIVIISVLSGGTHAVRQAETIEEAALGRVLEFPEGWELVTSYSIYTNPPVYICRSTDTDEYRECYPSTPQ